MLSTSLKLSPVTAKSFSRSVPQDQKRHLFDPVTTSALGAGFLGFVAFANLRYQVSDPNQYLIRTGLGIRDIKISKQGFQYPFQKYRFIDMTPKNYEFELHAMSNQKMEFMLPCVFTIGPKDDSDSLIKYSRYLLSDMSNTKYFPANNQLDELIKGIIEGETRVLSAQLTIDEIFNERAKFKDTIIQNCQKELDQYGLEIQNANVKNMNDTPGSEYFGYMRQKTRSSAEGIARVDIESAKTMADIGQKEKEISSRMRRAEFESLAVQKENETKQAIAKSNADLLVIEADNDRRSNIAKIEALKYAAMRDAELQTNVEALRYKQQIETKKANDLSVVNIEVDSVRLRADADLYSQQQKAEGIKKIYEAQADGIGRMIASFEGDREGLIQYLMLKEGLYPELGRINAQAIQGLAPKITVWQTGDGGKSDDYTKVIRNIMQAIPPLLTTINDQTGIKLPSSLIDLSTGGRKDGEER